jgi:hypothetical protein
LDRSDEIDASLHRILPDDSSDLLLYGSAADFVISHEVVLGFLKVIASIRSIDNA